MFALLDGSSFVRPNDVDMVAVDVLCHRLTIKEQQQRMNRGPKHSKSPTHSTRNSSTGLHFPESFQGILSENAQTSSGRNQQLSSVREQRQDIRNIQTDVRVLVSHIIFNVLTPPI